MKTFTFTPEKFSRAIELYELANEFKSHFPSCFSDNTLASIFVPHVESNEEKENRLLVALMHVTVATYSKDWDTGIFFGGVHNDMSQKFPITDADIKEHSIYYDQSTGSPIGGLVEDCVKAGILTMCVPVFLSLEELNSIRNVITGYANATGFNIEDSTKAKFTDAIEDYTNN